MVEVEDVEGRVGWLPHGDDGDLESSEQLRNDDLLVVELAPETSGLQASASRKLPKLGQLLFCQLLDVVELERWWR
jgi:hypothetical protein